MNILSIEASTQYLSVALFKDSQLVEEVFKEPDERGHSERLLPLIHQVLTHYHLQLSDLKALAVAVGPGSFTSLRVGLATVMGLCVGEKIPVQSVSSLKALAMGTEEDDVLIVPVMRAGRGRAYAAVYERQRMPTKSLSLPESCLDEAVFQPKELSSRIQKMNKPAILIGPGVGLIPEIPNSTIIGSIFPRARYVGLLAIQSKAKACGADELQVNYLQMPDLGSGALPRR